MVAATAQALADLLADKAPARGIDLAGAVPLVGAAPDAERWRDWLDAGRHGGLEYLQRTREERADPRVRNPGAATLLVFAQRYTNGWPKVDDRTDWLAGVARYARGLDYHDILLGAVKGLLSDLRQTWPDLVAYPAADTGPYLERSWAVAAGLGFSGRNTCLIHEALGSGLVLAVAPCNLELSGWETAPRPLFAVAPRGSLPGRQTDRCGTCTRCLEACPTGALIAPHQLDANRCLSTWTIEWQGRAPAEHRAEQGDLLFGCDICQQVCPWNARALRQADRRPPVRPEYQPLVAYDDLDLGDLMTMNAETFRERFRRTPLWRQHPEGLRRNALVAAVGARRHDLVEKIADVARCDPDPEVRDVATWAHAQLEKDPT